MQYFQWARKLLTISVRQSMVILWMLATAFGIAGLILCGIASCETPMYSVMYLGIGISILFVSISRIVRKEIEYYCNHSNSNDSDNRCPSKDEVRERIPWF